MERIESIYPLSPVQKGMLFHTLYAPESGVYVEQLTCILRGDLDATELGRAWQRVVNRHPVLRTAFVWEGVNEPVQIVHPRLELPIERLDWSALPPEDQERRLETYLETDRRRSFPLARAPLMRLALIRLSAEAHRFVWTHHHLLLDGWSVPLVMKEVFDHYSALREGRELHLPRPGPYQAYVTWLKKQSLSEAEAYWRGKLTGFSAPTRLAVDRGETGMAGSREGYDEQQLKLSAATTSALNAWARTHHLTLNTLAQAAWAILLSRYSGDEDVVYGATVSGRPPDLPGVEAMVGLFINTLPVRVRVPR